MLGTFRKSYLFTYSSRALYGDSMSLRKALAKVPRIISLVVFYFIVWFILTFLMTAIYILFYNAFIAPEQGIGDVQSAFVTNLSEVISGILVLAYIFRKKLFGKKE